MTHGASQIKSSTLNFCRHHSLVKVGGDRYSAKEGKVKSDPPRDRASGC